MFNPETLQMLWVGTLETLYMTLLASFLAYLFGAPLGILLAMTDKNGLKPMRFLNSLLNIIVNIARSIPFLILLVAVMPFTRVIVGTTIGSTATIVPLVIGAAPFVARLVESSLKEVEKGVIEAGRSMGCSNFEIIQKILLVEATPSLITGSAIAVTTILSYSAMAGFVGGGGLGDIAIRYGYYRYETNTMLITVILLVVIVQIMQEIGTRFALRKDKRI